MFLTDLDDIVAPTDVVGHVVKMSVGMIGRAGPGRWRGGPVAWRPVVLAPGGGPVLDRGLS